MATHDGYNLSNIVYKCPDLWNYKNSFFFAATIVTTIGYGNVFPHTNNGKGMVLKMLLFRYTIKILKNRETWAQLRNSLVLLGVVELWHVAQWVSCAPPHNTLPAFLNLSGRCEWTLLYKSENCI